ncbi:MAG: TetR/AcrR family transcriptional regulator, partial [Nakamurella sp.]
IAMEQLTAGGVAAVSLNAIARAMAMSPAAFYRYFDNRDELLAALVVEAYDSLADALEKTADRGGTVSTRITAVADACRDWALAHPHSYRLIFASTTGSGQDLAPERIAPAAQRSMDVFLALLSDLNTGPPPARDPLSRALQAQLRAWGQRSAQPSLSTATLYLGLIWWSRLHGLISLELGHHLQATGIDPRLLYHTELRSLLSQHSDAR